MSPQKPIRRVSCRIPAIDSLNPYQSPQATCTALNESAPSRGGLVWLLFSFEGRIPRRTWWIVSIPGLVVFVGIVLGGSIAISLRGIPVTLGLATAVVVTWIDGAVTCKRFHDLDKSGWWYLVRCIPYLGRLWLFVECGCLRGTDGPNVYGPDPT